MLAMAATCLAFSAPTCSFDSVARIVAGSPPIALGLIADSVAGDRLAALAPRAAICAVVSAPTWAGDSAVSCSVDIAAIWVGFRQAIALAVTPPSCSAERPATALGVKAAICVGLKADICAGLKALAWAGVRAAIWLGFSAATWLGVRAAICSADRDATASAPRPTMALGASDAMSWVEKTARAAGVRAAACRALKPEICAVVR